MRPVTLGLAVLLRITYGHTCRVSQLPETESLTEHFADFVHDTVSTSSLPLTIVTPALTASASQLLFKPAGYGTGARAYAYHYGLSVADSVDGKFVRDFALPVLFRENPHYSSTIDCTPKQRVLHVLKNVVLTDHGRLNWSSLPASAALSGISALYVPTAQQTWTAALTRFATNAAGRLVGDAYGEFCADLKRAIPFLPCPSKLNTPVARKLDVFRK
jgi:hypothetical protein